MVDPVANAENNDSQRALDERVAEAILNGGLPAAAAATPGPAGVPSTSSTAEYGVKLVSSGSAATAVIVNTAGQPVAMLTQSALNQVVQTGNTSLLGPQLLGVLASTGAEPFKFATQMVKVLH